MPIVLYRVVRSNPPTHDDFTSNKDRGRPPRGPELADPLIYESVSAWDSLNSVRSLAAGWRRPVYVAELRIPESTSVMVQQTFKPGHYSVKGMPDALLACVVYPLHAV